MPQLLKNIMLAGALVCSVGAAAQAATVSVGGSTVAAASGNNNFLDEMTTAVGPLTFLSPSSLTLSGPAKLTFTAVAAESGLSNGFRATGAGQLLENGNFGEGTNFLLGGSGQISGIFAGGSLDTLLTFFTQGQGTSHVNPGDVLGQFGVFVGGTSRAITTLFLAFDDNPNNPDDNHDDFIVRMDVAAVPLPAGGLLLIGGLAGLAALRRRKAQTA